jgi:soluble lytic murein transglycosylase
VRRLAVAIGLALVVLAAGWALVDRAMPGWYARVRYPLAYTDAIREAATRNRLDPALIAAMIEKESKFRSDASSQKGAVGLMQMLPSTAEEIARESGGQDFMLGDLHDPRINILYGSYYLRRLLDHYDGDEVAAVAAYNAGQGNVDSWLQASGSSRLRIADIPFAETREYVRDVERLQAIYRRAYGSRLGPAP